MATVPVTLVAHIFSYMTIPEVGEIAIHQMYRKRVVEIGDSRQEGRLGKKKSHGLGTMTFLKSYYFATPANANTTLYVDISSASPFVLTHSASVPSSQMYTRIATPL